MTAPLPVLVVGNAARAIADAADWWLANRTKAPQAFREELARGFELISRQPNVGARARNAALAGVRRIHLARIRYHLYYRVLSSPGRIEVLALWHTSRGSDPGL